MCKKIFLIFFGAISLHAQPKVTVTLDTQNIGAQIPADFVGLSFEMQRVLADTNGNHFFSAKNKNLIATFKTLGIKNLRVGGNTADRPTLPTPSQADVDALFAFAKSADVKIIFTLRLNQGDPADDAKMAGYILRHYQKQLDCFAIGNEPNVFSTNYEMYLAAWKRFAAQINSNSPDAIFCGPGVSPGHEKWSARFANDLASSGRIKFISQHDYPGGDARKSTNAAITRDTMLSPAMDEHYRKFANNFVPVVQSNGLAFRFEEANSLYDGGALDASDTFASALWALNFEWWWAAHGISGINFHTGDKVAARDENKPCRYATFWMTNDGFNVHPIGYAEKMFSLGSRGKFLSANVSGETNVNFSAFAILDNDKNLCVTLINKSHDENAKDLSVKIGTTKNENFKAIEIIRLEANGDVAAKTGVTLGGAEISDDAKWNGRWIKLKDASAIELPAASAALVKIGLR